MASVVTSILLEDLDSLRSATCPGIGVLVSGGYTLFLKSPQT